MKAEPNDLVEASFRKMRNFQKIEFSDIHEYTRDATYDNVSRFSLGEYFNFLSYY